MPPTGRNPFEATFGPSGGGFGPFGGAFDPFGEAFNPGGGVFDPGGGGGGGFSTRSWGLSEATISITSPKGPLVDETFRIEGTASVRMASSEFVKAGGQGHHSTSHWFVTEGFTVTVGIGDEEHEAQVTPQGDSMYWFFDVTDAETGDVTITATLDGTVKEGSTKSSGFGGTPIDSHTSTRVVHRTDSVDVTVEQGDVEVTGSVQSAMIGSPFEATVEGTVQSAFPVESVAVDSSGGTKSIENLSGDWSDWRAVVELPDRDEPYNVSITATNETGHTGQLPLTVPAAEPVVVVTRPVQDVETYLWQDGGITVTIEGTAGAEHATLQAVRWRLSNIVEVREGDATETGANWAEWSIDLDINRALTHVLEVWAVDAAGTESRPTESSVRELRVQVPGVTGAPGRPGVRGMPMVAFPVVQFEGGHGRF